MDVFEKSKKLLGARVRGIREAKGLTQEQLAEKADMHTVYLSNIERGRENPTFNMLVKIATALDVDMADLFDFGHEENLKQLKEMLRGFAGEIEDEKKLKTAVRVLRVIAR